MTNDCKHTGKHETKSLDTPFGKMNIEVCIKCHEPLRFHLVSEICPYCEKKMGTNKYVYPMKPETLKKKGVWKDLVWCCIDCQKKILTKAIKEAFQQ